MDIKGVFCRMTCWSSDAVAEQQFAEVYHAHMFLATVTLKSGICVRDLPASTTDP